jgi:hypothetical protein
MRTNGLLGYILLLLGIGFLVANVRLIAHFVRFLKMRRSARLTWPGPKLPFQGLLLAMSFVLGLLLVYKAVIQHRPPEQFFGEAMMFLYYAGALPLSTKILRGFYEDGVWAESGFMAYSQIGGLSWREGDQITLVLISRVRRLARRLTVPVPYYAAARRLLREKIASHDIHLSGIGLDLGLRDEREDV